VVPVLIRRVMAVVTRAVSNMVSSCFNSRALVERLPQFFRQAAEVKLHLVAVGAPVACMVALSEQNR